MRGLLIDAMSALHVLLDAGHDVSAAERESAVEEHGAKTLFGHAGFGDEQRFELRVAVLLDDEVGSVAVDERLDLVAEGKRSDAHVIGDDPSLAELDDRFAH